MPDDPDPPRRLYHFKEREFDCVNPRAGDANASAPIGINDLYRSANTVRPGVTPPAPPPPVDNEVYAMLRENHARAEAGGLNDLKPPPQRKSKRLRDYLIVMLAGNAFLVAGLFVNPVFAGAGLVLFNIGVTWTMWVVMDGY